MMNSLQKAGGVAALIMPATWILAFAVFLGVLDRAGLFAMDTDPAQKVAILADHHTIAAIGYLASFVLWGVLQVVLALALYERLKTGTPGLAQMGAAIGLILAGVAIMYGMIFVIGIEKVIALQAIDPQRAGTIWLTIDAMNLTENEILTGLWLLLVSWAALRVRELPRALNYIGLLAGVAGLLTVVPVLEASLFVFVLAHIVWYVWLGVYLLRSSPLSAPVTSAG
jgi:hypothetical protein